MADRPNPSDPAATAIAKAEALLSHLETSNKANPGLLEKVGRKVPAVRDWRIPVILALVLFAGQATVALGSEDGTVAAIFAVGAVTVAVLTGIVATLSYAQQSAVPFADLFALIKELLAALKAIKGKDATPAPSPGTGRVGSGDGAADEGPTTESLPPRPQER